MKRAVTFAILAMSARPALGQAKLSTTNKIMLGVSSAAILADCVSTRYAIKRGAIEENALLGNRPSIGRLNTVCASGLLLNSVFLGWLFRGNERNYAWGAVTGFELLATTHNLTLTFGVRF